MIPLPPALPTNHHSITARLRKGASPFAGSTTMSSSRKKSGAVAAGHRPATPYPDKVDSKEERRDPCLATEEGEGWRACYGQIKLWLLNSCNKTLK